MQPTKKYRCTVTLNCNAQTDEPVHPVQLYVSNEQYYAAIELIRAAVFRYANAAGINVNDVGITMQWKDD